MKKERPVTLAGVSGITGQYLTGHCLFLFHPTQAWGLEATEKIF
jgi:hypothetical protein